MTQKMKTYLFDFDGTLVNSMPTYASVMLKILDEYGAQYPSDIIKIITPLGFIGTADYYVDVLGIKESRENLIAKMNEYCFEAYSTTVPAKEGVTEALTALKKRGDSLNVLTASPHLTLDACLKRLGIFDIFDNVWSCNDFGTTKADPNIYRMCAERLGKEVGEIIFLDDNYNADKTAKDAGMIVFGVFDESSAEYTEQIKSITDGYITDFRELLS